LAKAKLIIDFEFRRINSTAIYHYQAASVAGLLQCRRLGLSLKSLKAEAMNYITSFKSKKIIIFVE